MNDATTPYCRIECADVLDFLRRQPDDSLDLVFGSPPYEDARTYGIDFDRKGKDWVAWMVCVYGEAVRCCRGLVAFVVEGRTRDYKWSATPALLMAYLHEFGFNLRKPPIYKRIGIPGSGGPDWLRNDYEWIVCVTKPGKLPWSDNTACGHEPVYGPGGVLSYRLSDGTRANQQRVQKMVSEGVSQREAARLCGLPFKTTTSGISDEGTNTTHTYIPPRKVNPGNFIDCTDVINCVVGGGKMGHALAHENEAPFPLKLADFFVKSFCPPGGVVCDPFSGSGTTAHAALVNGRNFVGCDVRESQVELTTRRVNEVMQWQYSSESTPA